MAASASLLEDVVKLRDAVRKGVVMEFRRIAADNDRDAMIRFFSDDTSSKADFLDVTVAGLGGRSRLKKSCVVHEFLLLRVRASFEK